MHDIQLKKPAAQPIKRYRQTQVGTSQKGSSMLGKFFKFRSSDKPIVAQNDSAISLSVAPIENIVPLMEAPVWDRADSVPLINTADTSSVVLNQLDIPTHGVRTQASELLNRFLGRQPILDFHGGN